MAIWGWLDGCFGLGCLGMSHCDPWARLGVEVDDKSPSNDLVEYLGQGQDGTVAAGPIHR